MVRLLENRIIDINFIYIYRSENWTAEGLKYTSQVPQHPSHLRQL